MKTILVDAVNTFVIKNSGVFKEMYELLESYPNPKIILTNANDEQIKLFGLDRVPYPLFTCRHAPEKTNPEYFRIFLKEKGVQAEEVIYFEHHPDAVKSAQSIGIRTYWYDSEKRDLSALKEFLDHHLYPVPFRKELDTLHLPKDQYALFGSAVLAVRGIRDAKDLDIVVKRDLWNILIQQYPQHLDESGLILRFGIIEISRDWRSLTDEVNAMVDTAEFFDDIPVVGTEYFFRFKKELGREKDFIDIELLSHYLSI